MDAGFVYKDAPCTRLWPWTTGLLLEYFLPGQAHGTDHLLPSDKNLRGKLRNIYFSPISRLGEIHTMRLPAPAKWKNLCGSFNINQLRKLTNNANIQRLIAWWHYCNLHGRLKGVMHHLAISGQLAECMEKYQKRNVRPEQGIKKIWNFLPLPTFLSFTELGNVQSPSDVHKVQTPILHTRPVPAPCILILHLWGGGRSVTSV